MTSDCQNPITNKYGSKSCASDVLTDVNLLGKIAIVTGGYSGIGLETTKGLVSAGAEVIVPAKRPELALKNLEGIVPKENIVSMDLGDLRSVSSFSEQFKNNYSKLDILINNVGVSMRGDVADLNPEVFKTVFESNVFGAVYPTIPALKELRKTNGSIVFISSLAGIRGLPFLSAYSSSKMALRGVAESIRIEEKKHNIHVGLVLVGITQIEHNKETISADGSKRVLKKRDSSKVDSTERVAKKVLKNIQKRKFITTLTTIGKLNKFLQARFPMLVEKIILRNLDKFQEKSE